jgi:hypothetical protein
VIIVQIQCYFSGIKRANTAVDRLKQEGFTKAYSDINAHDIISDVGNPVGGPLNSPNMSSLVLNTSDSLDSPEQGPLAAASPMASGMGGFEEIADVNYRVVVETDDDNVEKVENIIKNLGGELNNPNFKVPKGLDNVSFEEVVDKLSPK